jgi:CheY-like chemotaxis protein
MKILVADDHPANRDMLKVLLGALGHTVDVAVDGAEACAITEATAYDLVLMDLHMPVMDGLQAILVIGGRAQKPPRLVVVTADHSAESRAECLAAGADDVATKPLDLTKLAAIVAEALETTGSRRPVEAASHGGAG